MRFLPAAFALLILAAPAHAASVSVFVPECSLLQSKYGQCYPDEARFLAADGEANRVTVETVTNSSNLRLRDEGAPLQAGQGCTAEDEHTVVCTGYALRSIIATGDGDDVVHSQGDVDGGPGNDDLTGSGVIKGGPGDDHLVGGGFQSSLYGGPGADVLQGGDGNDLLVPDDGESGDHDVVDGGASDDMVSYEFRTDPLAIDLVAQTADPNDEIRSVERARGGKGADVLTGDDGPNMLDGGGGADRLLGAGGDDTLDGGRGADFVDGGAGADKVTATYGADRLRCGEGDDNVTDAQRRTEVRTDCEFVTPLGAMFGVSLRARWRPRAVALSLVDPYCDYDHCRLSARIVTPGGHTLGARKVKVPELDDITAPLRLRSGTARLLRHAPLVRFKWNMTMTGADSFLIRRAA